MCSSADELIFIILSGGYEILRYLWRKILKRSHSRVPLEEYFPSRGNTRVRVSVGFMFLQRKERYIPSGGCLSLWRVMTLEVLQKRRPYFVSLYRREKSKSMNVYPASLWRGDRYILPLKGLDVCWFPLEGWNTSRRLRVWSSSGGNSTFFPLVG